MIVNFSERAHNHNFQDDWIVRSLLDVDWYKLAMLQFIQRHFPRTEVTFGLINRTKSVKLAEIISEDELRRQLDYVKGLRFTKTHLIWLAGNTFYGTVGIFKPEFIACLADLQLPDYVLKKADGQFELTFTGRWAQVTLWEIYAIAIISELRTRAALKDMTEFEMDIFYAKAKAKLWAKIEKLKTLDGLSIADFGTRRRHSFLWQEYAVQAMKAGLGKNFIGTSNAYLAFKHDLEAIGTNAHELPMTLAAIAESDEEVRYAQYRVLELWRKTYDGAMLMALPDTFGTTQFFKNAPDWVADSTGVRQDSKNAIVEGEEYISWLISRGRDPLTKRYLCSDGLDVSLEPKLPGAESDPHDIPDLYNHFAGKIKIGFGWGTMLTNDFIGCHPLHRNDFDPISLVCKVMAANGRPAVKLSDNYLKATGPAAEIARYRQIFGTEGVENTPVLV